MKTVIQRVSEASVRINGQTISQIKHGLLVLIGIQVGDTHRDIEFLSKKILSLRIFDDENSKMNLSLTDVNGELLLVSQFTLLGESKKGNRPSYSLAEPPETAITLYQDMISLLSASCHVQTGKFGADMDVSLTNSGPVTILLNSRE